MELYYKNETLYVDISNDINVDFLSILKRRVFQILDDYGIDKIVILLRGFYDKELMNSFKREYYKKYKGYLLVKIN